MLRSINSGLIIIFLCLNAYALTNPTLPQDPAARLRSKLIKPKNPATKFNDVNKQSVPVEITYSQGIKIKGILYLWIKQFLFTHEKKRIIVKVEELKSIEFAEWKGYEAKNNAYIFYPSHIILILKDKKKYTIDRLDGFYRLLISDNNREICAYTYFYDYWNNGRWFNSGSSDKTYPQKNPHQAVVIKIDFL